jgi:plasmid stabilization system protein ParE
VNVRFLTPVQQEVDDVFVWFEKHAEAKGVDFLDELDRVVRLVNTYPYVSPQIELEIRRCLFARFPYSLVYGLDHDTIIVIPVAHTRRAPHYWVDRLKF